MDLLRKLILGLIVVALPLGEVARFSFNEVAITLMDIGTALTVLSWIFLKIKISHSDLKKPILIFTGVLTLSLFVNIPRLNANELLVSSSYLIRWIFYTLLFFAVSDLSSFRKKINKAMLIGGAVVIVGGFAQYFLYPDLRNLRYAGWDEHLYRMFSTFLDPNFAGSFFVLYFLFVSNYLNFKKKITFILPALTLIAIFLTFSRSAYIMLIVAAVIYSFLLKQKKTGIILVVLIINSIVLISAISLKSEGTNLLRTASGEARIDSMKNAVTIFKDHPLFGIGFNSYRYAQRNYGFINEDKMVVHSGAGTDNSFLFILATSGIIGFAAFIYLLLSMASIKDPLIVSSILALMVNSLFINSFFYPPIMLWLWILLGIRRST